MLISISREQISNIYRELGQWKPQQFSDIKSIISNIWPETNLIVNILDYTEQILDKITHMHIVILDTFKQRPNPFSSKFPNKYLWILVITYILTTQSAVPVPSTSALSRRLLETDSQSLPKNLNHLHFNKISPSKPYGHYSLRSATL